MDRFPLLQSPFSLKGVRLRSRTVWMAHPTGYVDDDGMPTNQYAEYVRARARGGVALIIIGGQSSHPDCMRSGRVPAFDPEVLPAYRQLTDAAHEGGVLIFGQLTDYGSQDTGDGRLAWAHARGPSSKLDPVTGLMPKAMDEDDIGTAVQCFGRAAALQREGGFDGVELNAGHSSLLRQFLSPLSNTRCDEYGGALGHRVRLLQLVVDEVRRQVGHDFPLGVHLCLDEQIEGGYDTAGGLDIAAHIGRWGVDYLSFASGIGRPSDSSPDMAVPEGHATGLIHQARQVSGLPVIASGRIKRPEMAERVLQAGHADLIGLVRPLIADPDWLAKATRGDVADIRPCIACNQACTGRHWQGKPISCIVNPAAGREAAWSQTGTAASGAGKRVVIVGGGPAGMKAAEIAARRGHGLTLVDRSPRLGGAMNSLLKIDSRREFGEAIKWSERQLELLRVELVLGQEVNAEHFASTDHGFVLRLPGEPREIALDMVVVATGAKPVRLTTPGADLPHAFSVLEALEREWSPGCRVAVWDEESGQPAASAAEQLAVWGCAVTIITPTAHPAFSLSPPVTAAHLQRLYAAGVEVVPYSRVISIEPAKVTVADVHAGRQRTLDPIDAVVYAGGWESDEALYLELSARGTPVRRAGDCVAPRDIGMAIYSAEWLARAL